MCFRYDLLLLDGSQKAVVRNSKLIKYDKVMKQPEAEVVPSSSLVEIEVGVKVAVEVGVEV